MTGLYTLEVGVRDEFGSARCRRLRRAGLVPMVLYGKNLDNMSLSVEVDKIEEALRARVRVFDVALPDGKSVQAMIKEVQWDELNDEILHVDLGRVNLEDRIEATIAIRLVGDSIGVSQGGTLEVKLYNLEVRCRVDAIPDRLTVNVSELGIEDEILVRDLGLPDGVEATLDDDSVVCRVRPQAEEADDASVEGEAAEPELIRPERKPEDDA